MGYKQYCKNPEKIENFEKAKADNFKGWNCHHRLETWNSDGERRLVDITAAELKVLDMYYNRPPEELIFLTSSEHIRLHKKGKPKSEEHKRKMSESNKGKRLSEEHKRKISEAKKNISEDTRRKIGEALKGKYTGENNSFYGKHHSMETRKRMSEAHRGKHCFNNGKENKFCFECPEGFVPGQLK